MHFKKLEDYYPQEEECCIFNKLDLEKTTFRSFDELQKLALFPRLKKAISFEYLQACKELNHLSVSQVKLCGRVGDYMFKHPNIVGILASRWREMDMCLIPMKVYEKHHYTNLAKYSFGGIKDIDKDQGTVSSKHRQYINCTMDYHVDFTPNRISLRACSSAIESLECSELKEFFSTFNSVHGPDSHFKIDAMRQEVVDHFEWYNENIAYNKGQMLLIKNVVSCTAHPYPHVVFGPPGTGKTSTLVECVLQITKVRPRAHILIATQSNSAADEIGLRLLKYISLDYLYRIYSPSLISATSKGPDPTLRTSSNLKSNFVEWPSKEQLQDFPIIISTLMTTSRLIHSNMDSGHFDYIFVDETSCATEPEALVPIVGLGIAGDKVTANIVLLGDHLQLGPVLMCEEYAGKLGLAVSMMERLMGTEKYLKKPTYDDRYVVQLLDNYRSHPAILKFSSDQFYDGALRAKMTLADQELTEGLNFLPNKKFPILFHDVQTLCDLSGTSFYNDGEIKIVAHYIRKLLATKFVTANLQQSDIGVISPYLAQLAKLKVSVGLMWPQIEMGTAEYFQGREKRVIIITTVKSHGGTGFLSNHKRSNVMLTRAKSLQIIIGSIETLSNDQLWKAFIKYCEHNGGVICTQREQSVSNAENSFPLHLTLPGVVDDDGSDDIFATQNRNRNVSRRCVETSYANLSICHSPEEQLIVRRPGYLSSVPEGKSDFNEVDTCVGDEKVLFVHRAKLLRYENTTKQWVVIGIGDMEVLVHKINSNKARLLMRSDVTFEIWCNLLITKELRFNMLNRVRYFFSVRDNSEKEVKFQTLLAIKFYTPELMQNFLSVISTVQANLGEI